MSRGFDSTFVGADIAGKSPVTVAVCRCQVAIEAGVRHLSYIGYVHDDESNEMLTACQDCWRIQKLEKK